MMGAEEPEHFDKIDKKLRSIAFKVYWVYGPLALIGGLAILTLIGFITAWILGLIDKKKSDFYSSTCSKLTSANFKTIEPNKVVTSLSFNESWKKDGKYVFLIDLFDAEGSKTRSVLCGANEENVEIVYLNSLKARDWEKP